MISIHRLCELTQTAISSKTVWLGLVYLYKQFTTEKDLPDGIKVMGVSSLVCQYDVLEQEFCYFEAIG